MNTDNPQYKETLDYLFHSLPAYHRIGAAAYKADLDNTHAMMQHLRHPEKALRVIHVAGTNGKGSVSHFLAAVLHRSGHKVGLYTSPHLIDFRERIRINGEMIPCQYVTDFVARHRSFFVAQGLSFFEMTVGLAFDYFRQEHVDYAVIEVGMGGRLDSTNVVKPLLSIITNIGLDHTQFLGKTLPEIAVEKAGIIKKDVPVIIGETQPETEQVFINKAQSLNAPITFADQHFSVEEHHNDDVRMLADIRHNGNPYMRGIHSPLDGIYQRKNLATVMAAIEQLKAQGVKLTKKGCREGIANVIADTGLQGRWQLLAKRPTIICETAHNAPGVEALCAKLSYMRYRQLHIVYGCVNDKDYVHILEMLPHDARYYYTRPSVQRGLDAHTLQKSAQTTGRKGEAYTDVYAALDAARAASYNSDLIVVTGSIFLVADLLADWDNYWQRTQPTPPSKNDKKTVE